jgi:hypothetical protein
MYRAVPTSLYDITGCDISRVSDTKPYYRKPALTILAKMIKFLVDPLQKLAIFLKLTAAKFDYWSACIHVFITPSVYNVMCYVRADAERRYNQMISVKLKVKYISISTALMNASSICICRV